MDNWEEKETKETKDICKKCTYNSFSKKHYGKCVNCIHSVYLEDNFIKS